MEHLADSEMIAHLLLKLDERKSLAFSLVVETESNTLDRPVLQRVEENWSAPSTKRSRPTHWLEQPLKIQLLDKLAQPSNIQLLRISARIRPALLASRIRNEDLQLEAFEFGSMKGEGGLSGSRGGKLNVTETTSGLVALGRPASVENGAVL